MRPTSPWHAVAVAAIALAATLWVMPDTPRITPAEAADHAGRRVQVIGSALDVHQSEARLRFQIMHGGQSITATWEGHHALDEGAWVEVTGTLSPDLHLFVDHVKAEDFPQATHLLSVLARPEAALGDPVWVVGDVTDGRVHAAGHVIQVDGAPEGTWRLQGILDYEGRCACYLLRVDRWSL